MKTCSKCKTPKPINAFSKKAKTRDGRSTICKDCKTEYDKFDKMNCNEKEFSDKKIRENQAWLVMIMPYQGIQVSRWINA